MNAAHLSLATVLALVLCAPLTLAAEAPANPDAAPEAHTTEDPDVPVEDLQFLVKPLTLAELEVEAEGWLGLLKAKVEEISLAEIVARRKRRQAQTAEKAAGTLEQARKTVERATIALEEARVEGDAAGIQAAAEALESAEGELAKLRAASEKEKSAEARKQGSQLEAKIDDAARQTAEKADEKAAEEGTTASTVDVAEEGPESVDVNATSPGSTESLEQAKQAEEQKAKIKSEQKTKIQEGLTRSYEERARLAARLEVVLRELESKGGDPAPYRKYVSSVTAVQIDYTDLEAAWIRVRNWARSGEGGLLWFGNFARFVGTLVAFWFLAQLVGLFVRRATGASRKVSGLMGVFLVNMLKRLTLLIGFVMAIQTLGVSVAPILALMGAAGLVVGLALQGTLSNFASGILILTNRPFDVGDWVEAGGVAGTVKSVSLFSTKITTGDNQLMIVPNNSIWGNVIKNSTGLRERRVDLLVNIGYDDDVDKALEILGRIVAEDERILADPEPVIRMHALSDSSVDLICRPWVLTSDFWPTRADLLKRIKQEFDAAGISIPYPQQEVHMHTVTKPADT